MAASGAKAGLKALCFTEHVDIDELLNPAKAEKARLFPAARKEFPATKAAFAGKIDLLFGAELGQPFAGLDYTEKFLAEYAELDFVLCSLHGLPGRTDFYYIPAEDMNPALIKELLAEYFTELKRICVWGKFDSLAHITYPLRYMIGRTGSEIDLEPYYNAIDDIFRTIIAKNIALEVNTSGLRIPQYERTDPWRTLLERYHALGGELLTLGSDAHEARFVGAGLEQTARLLKETGFSKAVYYRKHKAVAYDL